MGVEYYLLAQGERGPGAGPYGWESDLFAGLPVGDAPPATLATAPEPAR